MARRKRAVPLTRLVLDGLNVALTHAETMMAPDPVTFGPEDWRRHEAARRWLEDKIQQRGLKETT